MTDATPSLERIPPIVSSDWLDQNGDVVIICDVRYYLDERDGWTEYLRGHLPGARYVDMDSVLAGPPGPKVGRHPLPDPRIFAKGLGALGIGDDAVVVAYDDLGGMTAGRLVWMLRRLGQPAALLDGGLQSWKRAIETGRVEVDPVERTARPWPEGAFVDADKVARHAEVGGVVVDSRAPARFAGETEPIDPRAGHVPGAINLPFADNLGPNNRFLHADELAVRFGAAGVDGDAIIYCGSGVSACHNLLAIEMAGLGTPRLYVGSWSGWSSDPDRPVAVDG